MLESGGSAGYLASRMLRPWWMPYPMANGEVRRMKRREAILDDVDLHEVEKKGRCCDVVIRLSGASYG